MVTTITIVTIAVVVVPSPTKPVDEVVQSVAHIVAHVRTSGGSSKSTCNTTDNLSSILLSNHIAESASNRGADSISYSPTNQASAKCSKNSTKDPLFRDNDIQTSALSLSSFSLAVLASKKVLAALPTLALSLASL